MWRDGAVRWCGKEGICLREKVGQNENEFARLGS